MDYVIYTYGGQDLVVQVFNAIGRIFQSEGTYFTPVGKFALSLGGVWALSRAIYHQNIGIFGKNWFMPMLLSLLLLFTPKATVWIKDDVLKNAPHKVDHIPFAVAFFSSLSSSLSYTLSALIEENLSAAEGVRYTHSGLLFGAKLVGKIKDVKIENPIVLENTKNFCKQCYTKPWIMGNLLGKRKEALESNNIFDFIKSNMPNNFGIYYKEMDGSISFKTCKEALPLIESGLAQEILSAKPYFQLSDQIGLGKLSLDTLSRRLLAVGGDTLALLGRENLKLHDWVKQAMLLNANREAVDDWREGHGMARFYPALISMNATRGTLQQSFGWITAGEMAAEMLPLLQTILFSMVISLIFVVFPLTLLPGGMTILTTWIKMLLWVNSWPLFFSIINGLGMMVLSNRAEVFGSAGGLSVLSQGHFSEMILNVYAIVQLFATMVPIISWAVLSKSGQIFASLSERLSPAGAGSALGTAMADNTLNLDTITFGGRSVGHQIAPNMELNSRSSYGERTLTQTYLGESFIDQKSSQLRQNFGAHDNISEAHQLAEQEMIAKQSQLSEAYNDSLNQNTSQVHDFAHAVSSGSVSAEGWTRQDQQSFNRAFEKVSANAENYAARDHKSTESSSALQGEVHAGLTVGGAVAKFLGGDLGGSMRGSTSGSARNSEDLSRELTAGLTESERQAIGKFQSFSDEKRFTATDEATKRLTKSAQVSLSEQHQYAKQLQELETYSENWSQAKTSLISQGGSLHYNLNDAVLDKIVEERGGTKAEAASWISENPHEAPKYLRDAIEDTFEIKALPKVPERYQNTQEKVREATSNRPSFKTVIEKGQEARTNLLKSAENQGITLESMRETIDEKAYNPKQNAEPVFDQEEFKKCEGGMGQVTHDRASLQERFNKETDSTVLRAGGEALENVGSSAQGLYSKVSEARGTQVYGEKWGKNLKNFGKRLKHKRDKK